MVSWAAQLEGYQYSASQNRMRMRMFNVLDDVKRQHGFCPIVTRPAGAAPLCAHHTPNAHQPLAVAQGEDSCVNVPVVATSASHVPI